MIETQEQALAEARRRWGNRAAAKEFTDGTKMLFANYPYQIKGACDMFHGWDAAFADADRKKDV